MYAVINDKGKQYFVEPDQRVLIDLRDAAKGDSIEFDEVLMVGGGEGGPSVGKPTISGAKVVAEVIGHVKMKKVMMVMFKRRKNSKKTKGHRQPMTEVKITSITA